MSNPARERICEWMSDHGSTHSYLDCRAITDNIPSFLDLLVEVGLLDKTEFDNPGRAIYRVVTPHEHDRGKAELGLATNAEMIQELAVRYEIGHVEPDYRTVDS